MPGDGKNVVPKRECRAHFKGRGGHIQPVLFMTQHLDDALETGLRNQLAVYDSSYCAPRPQRAL